MIEKIQSVPMGNLFAQYELLKPEIDSAIERVIATSNFIRGPEVDKFEINFADIVGSKFCVSCANGTDALYIAMMALGVRQGDQVIVPAMSWISTSETVSQAGAQVVFCDIDPITNTLDPAKLETCITDSTVGIIPVHLYGHPANLEPILDFASRHGLWVIEDTAQAHLAKYKGQHVGTFGSAATFSFYPGKNLGAFGDAGAILTENEEIAQFMTKYARHGGLRKGDHEIEGINSRLDGLQAAILSAKLPYLREWTDRRREIASYYQASLNDIEELVLPQEAEWAEHVWHLFVVRSHKRNYLAKRLGELGVETSVNYPIALPFLPCYANKRHTVNEFPNAYQLSKEGLSLPLYPELSDSQIEHVVASVRAAVR